MLQKPRNDLTGQRFKSLTVTGNYRAKQTYKSDGSLGGHKYEWECICDCGAIYWMTSSQLRNRHWDYCVNCKPIPVRDTKLYHIYHGMKKRCYNQNDPRYKNYGGRGIRISDEWLESYDAFKKWAIDNGYIDGKRLSIDRINNDGDYCAENCQWLTISENTAKGDTGVVKSHSWMTDMYAISPDGKKIEITNIAKFARDYNLNLSSVGACLRGYHRNTYNGWLFHSSRSRD